MEDIKIEKISEDVYKELIPRTGYDEIIIDGPALKAELSKLMNENKTHLFDIDNSNANIDKNNVRITEIMATLDKYSIKVEEELLPAENI